MFKKFENKTYPKTVIPWLVLLASILTSWTLTLSTSYTTYAYTDIAGVDPLTMGAYKSVVDAIVMVNAFFAGFIIAKTRTKMGRYRPYLIFVALIDLIGGIIMFVGPFSTNMNLVALVISIGYFLVNAGYDYIFSSRIALNLEMAGADSDLRTVINSRQTMGNNIGRIISGAAVLPLVALLGQGNDARGFRLTQCLILVLCMTGFIIYCILGSPYDKDNTGSATNEKKVSILAMLKAVIVNPYLVILILRDIIKSAGTYVFNAFLVYHCIYVLGDRGYMSSIISSSAIAGMIGAYISPIISRAVGGRRKAAWIYGFMEVAAGVAMATIGRTLGGMIGAVAFYYAVNSLYTTIDYPMYGDAAEYWLNKTGENIKALAMSFASLAVKAGIFLSSLIVAAMLNLIGYEAGMTMNATQVNIVAWSTGGYVALGYGLGLVLLIFYKISDADAVRYIKENQERAQAAKAENK